MIVGVIDKQPNETFPITVDYTNELTGAETVSTATVTSKNAVSGADTTSTICNGAATVTTPRVAQIVRNGADGEKHEVTFRATTSAGNVYEHEVMLVIQEI